MKNHRLTRRDLLRGAAAATVAAPYLISSSALGKAGKPPASERVALGHIGVGNQGSHDTAMLLADPRAQIVAACDVDLARAKAAAASIESHYARGTASGTYRGCAVTQDFRDIIARDDIDAVMIATPDHNHALIAIAAARRGKDIYCEKPLAYSVAEGRAIVEAFLSGAFELQGEVGERYRRVNDFHRFVLERSTNGGSSKWKFVSGM